MFKRVFPSQIVSIFFSALFLLASCSEQNDPLIDKANEEWINGHNHSALEILSEVLKNNPSGKIAEEALFRMGEIHHFSLNNSTRAGIFSGSSANKSTGIFWLSGAKIYSGNCRIWIKRL